ncbi:MAG: CHASE2 domain-containing protein [Thermodesulfobacteriota bacterium]
MFGYGIGLKTRVTHALVVAGVSFLAAVLLWAGGFITELEYKTWDRRVALMAEPGVATRDIAIILVDQNSLDWASETNAWSWPWPRVAYAAILDFLGRGSAKALALDVLFTEPSVYGVEDDREFQAAARRFGRSAVAIGLSASHGAATQWPAFHSKPGFFVEGADDWFAQSRRNDLTASAATLPAPDLANGFRLLANVDQNPDEDSIYRRVAPFKRFDRQILPLLGIGAYLAANPEESIRFSENHVSVGTHLIPTDDRGNVILRFRGPSGTHSLCSAAAVIRSELLLREGRNPPIDPAVFKDKYVFLGFSAKGLHDTKPIPLGKVYSGVEVNATLLDNFLSRDFIRPAPLAATIVFVLILSLSCAFSVTFARAPILNLLLTLAFIGLPLAAALAAYRAGFWLPLVTPEVAVMAACTLSLVVNFAVEGVQKQFIKSAFQQYLNPAVIEDIIRNPEKLVLGGDRREISIFFSDIQGFTAISESLEPEALTAFLNDYLSAMTDIIHEEGGTVDKYEGDAIIAFWNAPQQLPDHPLRAVTAALRCQEKLAALRPVYERRIGRPLYMRIGLNTGPAVVGNMGSKNRFNYTMIGDAVNLAARLEGANKEFGTFTMVSENTRKLAQGNVFYRELGKIAVVGKTEAVGIFEPISVPRAEAVREVLAAFQQGLALFYQGEFPEAARIFSGIETRDPPAAAYCRKCRELAASPAPENWQGVWVLKSK